MSGGEAIALASRTGEPWPGPPRVVPGSPELAYWREGEAGPRLLLIMGLAMPGRVWRPQVEGLRSDHRLLFFDHRGIGASAHRGGGWDLKDLARDALRLMDAEGWADAHVVGVSLGGMVAQELALQAPERVRSLVLLATHAGDPRAKVVGARALREILLMQILPAQRRFAALHRLLYPAPFLAEVDRGALLRRTADQLAERAAPSVLFRQLWAVLRFDTRGRLDRLDRPSLVMTAGQDLLVPPSTTDRLARRIGGARLVRFEEAGHGLIFQVAGKVNQTIREFVRDHETAPA
ncbi:MAG: alpha/beta fold hydrolase [Sandaracinaceae bacterium]